MPKRALAIGGRADPTMRQFSQFASPNIDLMWLDDITYEQESNLRITPDRIEIPTLTTAIVLERGTPIYQRIYAQNTLGRPNNERIMEFYRALFAWALIPDNSHLIINRPQSGHSNASKGMHCLELQRFGFQVPEWIVSTSSESIKTWAASNQFQYLVVKGNSGHRTEVRRVRRGSLYNSCGALEHPTMVQREIRGYDVRVHWIGTQYVATKITSDCPDYRYARSNGGYANFELCSIPAHVQDLCWRYAWNHQLEFIGFDFKVDSEGCYWVLEANAMPGYGFFDKEVDGAISTMLVRYLLSGTSAISSHRIGEASLLAFDQIRSVI